MDQILTDSYCYTYQKTNHFPDGFIKKAKNQSTDTVTQLPQSYVTTYNQLLAKLEAVCTIEFVLYLVLLNYNHKQESSGSQVQPMRQR